MLLLAAAPQVWIEPSTVHVLDGAVRSDVARNRAELFAAQGEWESFQVCVVAGEEPLERVTVVPPTLPGLPAPQLFRVAYVERGAPSSRSSSTASFWPDALVPAQPVNLQPKGFATFWVTYQVPTDAKPGRHRGTLRVETPSRRRAWKLGCSVQVFNFALPTSALPLLAPVNPPAVAAALPGEGVLARLYGQLAAFGVGPLLRGPVDALTPEANPTALGVPYGLPVGIDPGPAREAATVLEIAPGPLPIPGSPSATDPRTLWCGSLAPSRQGRAALWAAPMRDWSPGLPEQLASGMGLARRAPLQGLAAASAAGSDPDSGVPSQPGDACDGSVYTAWYAPDVVQKGEKTWWAINFDAAHVLSEMEIVWVTGRETTDLKVDTSYDGVVYTPATLRWKFLLPEDPYGHSRAVGTFRYPQQASALRLTLTPKTGGRSVGIAEIRFGNGDAQAEISTASRRPQALWLLADAEGFPSASLDAHPAELRFLPLVLWGHGLGGAVLSVPDAFPEAWTRAARDNAPPLFWPAAAQAPLLYPVGDSFAPSARLMRLHDGVEDYEYRLALGAAAATGKLKNPNLLALVEARPYNPRPGREDLEGMLSALAKQRQLIGRALGKLSRNQR